jgi:outer membrane immunogenic protein
VGAHVETLTHKLTWFSTTRARIGRAHDRWMIFAAGGLASGHIKSSSYLSGGGADIYSGAEDKTRYAWTVGSGVEYALSQNWFLRGEYLYIDLGKCDYTSDHVPATTANWNTEVNTKVQVARVALTYRFTRAGSPLGCGMGGFKY